MFEKSIVLLLSIILILGTIVGCSQKSNDNEQLIFEPGIYTGEATGFGGTITVETTVSDSKIEKIEIVEHSESEGISDPALETIPKTIVDQQSLAIDTISGATITSEAIIEATQKALEQATDNLDPLFLVKEKIINN